MAFYIQISFMIYMGLFSFLFQDGSFDTVNHPSFQFFFKGWVWPDKNDFMIIFFIGVFNAFGGYLISQAYRLSFAGLVAPFEYSALVFSIFWGIIILDEFLNLLSIIGILIILVSGVLIAVRETIKDRPLSLKKILDNYEGIMKIIIPTLGKERQKTYSPFLPICKETGQVLEIPIIEINKKNSSLIFDNNGKKLETSILDGNCKLQWKVDWAMRWYALDVDFEMYGKDLIESAILSTKIIRLLGKQNPSGFAYELFLDEKGEKISKSKGNGITIDEWLDYASPESLSLFMYQNPKRAKKLYKEIVPKAVDEYLENLEKGKNQNELQLLMNPAWHVHDSNMPSENPIMTFSMLLNLVETSNADTKELLWKFVKKYKTNIEEKNHPIFDNLINYAIKYFNDVIKINKKYKKPNETEKKALEALIQILDNCNDDMKPEDIQTQIYTAGKENGYKENLRDWFKLIYEVVFGDENGPRMGFFISFFGVQETKQLVKSKLDNV